MPEDYDFLLTAKELAEKLQEMDERGAAVVPLLDDAVCKDFARASRSLPFRQATPVIGEGEKAVYQDFLLCYDLPGDSPYRNLAARLETSLVEALNLLSPPLLRETFVLNDLILQHYPAGCRGISAHRDHLRYRGLVALVILAGQGDFVLCENRRGDNPRPFSSGKGDLLLMSAPGLGGREDRPFHYLANIRSDRLSFGCRHDVRLSETP